MEKKEQMPPAEAPPAAPRPPRDAPARKEPAREAPARVPTEPGDVPERDPDPAPGVRHEPEPDAGNIMPAEDEPGTF